ncbi:hypothetical protein GQX73_g2848 [Xylaria multiplex]|uniref:Uncharacterized protein n=1 Tax=Xylaria multiplex TaxID=323545 RepID=A0A7C8IRY4_9PEZI|nr:hypothetical protein GQX73_g2848 [Xylaria multiplex]
MEYDDYIKEAIGNGIPQERAERDLAKIIHAHMNELAKNATNLYETALEERCKEQGQRFVVNRPAPEEFPLEIFTTNIKANKLDNDKWAATLQEYLLHHMPKETQDVPPLVGDDSHQIMHRLNFIDQTINKSLPLEKDIPEGAQLFVPLIPIGYFVGVAAASLITSAVGGIGLALHLKKKEPAPHVIVQPPPTVPAHGGGPGGPGDPSPPPPPPQPNEEDRERKRRRKRDRERKRGRDIERKSRSDCYFGYVDRVDKLANGYEIRVEAIAENSLSDEVFIRAIQKMSVAAGSPGFGRYRLALVWIYVHTVPSSVSEGSWISFKINQQNKRPVTKETPNLTLPFDDGLTVLESLEPKMSFRMSRIESYFANNWGYVVQTEMQTITKEILASSLTTLQQVFGSFNAVGESIREVIGQVMHHTASASSEDTSHSDSDVTTSEALAASTPISFARIPSIGPSTGTSIRNILLPRKEDVLKYSVFDVGQGHSARAFDEYGPVFASDFGFGKVGNEEEKICYHMINGQGTVPILLSHWDSDHYRIAKSESAWHVSGTTDDITQRPWIAPGRTHITGTIGNELAWLIQQNKSLYQWTDSVSHIKTKNVTVVRCQHNGRFNLPDKNNYGALALFIGRGNNLMLYPGDANFESIPDINSASGNIRSVIATHHGSTRSLEGGRGQQTGANIPRASTGEAYTVFSYAEGNSYGHDIKNAFPLYQQKGYDYVEATAVLGGGEDTLEICHFGQDWDASDSMLMADLNEAGAMVTESITTKTSVVKNAPSPGENSAAFKRSSLPAPPADWAKKARDLSPAKLHDSYQRGFPEVLTLTGLGSNGGSLDHDDLAEYAIKDADGDVVFYDIIATKIILDKLPLNVPCKTDYPVTVQITCQDIELSHPAEQMAILPLVRFNVASGAPWPHPANPGTDGMSGDSGYAGGRLRLAVAGNWLGVTQELTSPVMGISIQYRGGHGGDGQTGGALRPWDSHTMMGSPGTLDSFGVGGDAGEPGTIADSEILTVADKWPKGWKVEIDVGQAGTDSEFGKPGKAGKGGGDGNIMIGVGGLTPVGGNGKEFDKSNAQFHKAQMKLSMIATEREILSQMAPVDWRYLS